MWQLAIALYFLFGATSYLLRRVLAQKHSDYNRTINVVFFLFFLLPAGIILSFFFPHNLDIGLLNLLLLLGGSVIWPALNIVAFKANKKTEVGIFVIINNLSPLFPLAIALPFLHESLAPVQFVGIGLLIFSGVIAASSHRSNSGLISMRGIAWSLLSTAILGIAVAYETFMLGRVDFGTYLIFGWGAQIAWAIALAGPELKKLPALFRESAETTKMVLAWGLTSVLKSIAFILALKISMSASIISAASNFMSVAVVIAAYMFLKERTHILSKIFAVAAGIAGLLLIAS